MHAPDVINYVAKLNMNVMASMFSPLEHVKRWRDEKQKSSADQSNLVTKMFLTS